MYYYLYFNKIKDNYIYLPFISKYKNIGETDLLVLIDNYGRYQYNIKQVKYITSYDIYIKYKYHNANIFTLNNTINYCLINKLQNKYGYAYIKLNIKQIQCNPRMNYNLIVCRNLDNAIGINNDLLFKLKYDMEWFKTVTTTTRINKNAVIMGYNTWKSIPDKFKPLKDRINIVLSRNNTIYCENTNTYFPKIKSKNKIIPLPFKYKDTYIFKNYDSAISFIENCNFISNIFVIGGEQIYKLFLEKNKIDNILVSNVFNNCEKCSKNNYKYLVEFETNSNYNFEKIFESSYIDNDKKKKLYFVNRTFFINRNKI